jgi:membrane protein involved in colicin uptake
LGILKKVGDLLSPSDPELVEKTLARLNEQDTWNDVFSTKLIELLDKIDQIKSEIRQRLRDADKRIQRAESVTQAESILREKAAQFGDASRRLEAAQVAEERATMAALDAKRSLEKTTTALDDACKEAAHARNMAEDATAKLRTAHEAEMKASRLSRYTVRTAAVAVALSWIALVWVGWLMFAGRMPLWSAISFSFVFSASAGLVVWRTRNEA